MSSRIPTPHINAPEGAFADTVLMPGDPLRSRFIAEQYLENAELINNVRGVQGYTGSYKGKKVSVMASGMGCPASIHTSCLTSMMSKTSSGSDRPVQFHRN